jgi:glutaconate CoA-transferase, subunit A
VDGYREWTAISKDPARLRAWLSEWVHDVPDHAAYLRKRGKDRWRTVEVGQRLSGQVDYGRRLP